MPASDPALAPRVGDSGGNRAEAQGWGQQGLGNCKVRGGSGGPSFCLLTLSVDTGESISSLPCLLPGLSEFCPRSPPPPSLVPCGHGRCPHPTIQASPLLIHSSPAPATLPGHSTSGPLQVGLTYKNIPAFFELVIYYFYQMVQAKRG